MTLNKILIAGASENFVNDLNRSYHYTTLLQTQYNINITNISVEGMSNDEIFYRCIVSLECESYDFVLIMWAPLNRKWIYFADDNVDCHTLINAANPSPLGWREDESCVVQYNKLHWTYFNNEYILLRNWLSQITSLQNTLITKNIPYLMLHDVDNYITDLLNFSYTHNKKFSKLTNEFKQVVNFDNKPDDYILEKVTPLKQLLNNINQDHWIDFVNYRFSERRVDLSNDQQHAGPLSHQLFADLLINELKQRKLLY